MDLAAWRRFCEVEQGEADVEAVTAAFHEVYAVTTPPPLTAYDTPGIGSAPASLRAGYPDADADERKERARARFRRPRVPRLGS